MTLPCERVNAIINAREFLRSLLVPSKTPRVPKEIRRQARYILKHFPSDFDMQRIFTNNGVKEIFGDSWKEEKED